MTYLPIVDRGNVKYAVLTLPDPGEVPPTSESRATMYVDPSDGDLKIKFADGTIKTIVTDT